MAQLLKILVVLVPILLSVAFMRAIERKVMGSQQQQAGFNVVSYRVLSQFVGFTVKLVAIVIAGFTVLIFTNSLGFDPDRVANYQQSDYNC